MVESQLNRSYIHGERCILVKCPYLKILTIGALVPSSWPIANGKNGLSRPPIENLRQHLACKWGSITSQKCPQNFDWGPGRPSYGAAGWLIRRPPGGDLKGRLRKYHSFLACNYKASSPRITKPGISRCSLPPCLSIAPLQRAIKAQSVKLFLIAAKPLILLGQRGN